MNLPHYKRPPILKGNTRPSLLHPKGQGEQSQTLRPQTIIINQEAYFKDNAEYDSRGTRRTEAESEKYNIRSR
jgi:hypothetical protein